MSLLNRAGLTVGGLFLVLTLSGCGGLPLEPPVALSAPAHSVVVITSIPKEIGVGYQGITVFNNEYESIDVADWRLQDVAAKAAKEDLASRFDVRTVSWLSPPLSRNFNAEDFGKTLKDQQSTLGAADLYVVISPDYNTWQLQNTKIGFVGFGVSKITNPFVTRPPIVHSFGVIALYDGVTCNLIATRRLKMSPDDRSRLSAVNDKVQTELLALGLNDDYIPAAPLTDPEWTGDWNKLTPSQKAETKQTLTKLIDLSVRFTLDHMFGTGGKSP